MTPQLPKEIILAIIEEIDEPQDLLSFALCNHVCKRIIIPRHLSFRHIRYGEAKASLWRFLVDRPILIRRLRKLELVDMALTKPADWLRPRSLPGRKRFLPYTNPSRAQIRDLIGEMFPLLVRLRRFVWMSCFHPDVFHLLEKFGESSMLRELHIDMYITLSDYLKVTPWRAVQPNKPMTWNLRSVAIEVTCDGSIPSEIRTLENNIQTLLSHSPLLEDLYLIFSWQAFPMIEDLLKSSRWPFLRRFTLGYLVSIPETHISAPTLAHFFRAHPGLCSLAFLRGALLPPGSIPADALPGLRDLIYQGWDTALADVLPVEVARRLVTFHGNLCLEEEGGRYSRLLSQMTNLETCNLTDTIPNGRLLGDAIRGLSHLTRLFYQSPFGWFGPEHWLDNDEEPIPELATLLSLKRLVHLSGPALQKLSPEDPRTTALDLLIKNLPRLLFVRASFSSATDTADWLKIVRPSSCSSSREQTTAPCTTTIRDEVQFIPTSGHEYPKELMPERWAYFNGFAQ